MELAAANKGLSSIVQLDYNTLQTLDAFRDSLCTFPSESIQLKKPFSFQPWVDSEDNVGNLLMIWRFCITFADVLGLWPFTLDEFIQALHDYDSRLLGEIHISLLKLIIKDIEDGGRAPSGLGTNQYSVANPEGGHPHIVEGAYMWGFDIRKWQQLLNPLSWPEIFRELALSAGLGPQLRDKNAAWRRSNDEAKRYQETVSTIRNGLAAENAFALMREKGLLNPRKSRHRLTPGTVKFAAFHVLSLEGGEGLTLIELADKIQKSGLRDLSTSRTPEASISVALTRDQKLFERVAPSTYCVRDPYRKDPADGEAILAEARKKIHVFANGFLEGEDADEVADDVERDDDSDDDPEVDDLSTPLRTNEIVGQANGIHTPNDDGKENAPMEIENDDAHIWSSLIVKNESENDLSRFPQNGVRESSTPGTIDQFADRNVLVGNATEENAEIDESKSGESWVQGLAEGEYSHLSVEERLDALFKLVGIANEGSIIRAVLEDRLEAATALKKQMWAEAQSDKSLLREDVVQILGVPSGNPSLLHQADDVDEQKLLLASENVQNGNVHDDRTAAIQDLQLGYSSKRFRSQLKAYTAHVAEETYSYRSLPLGQDRRRNRYWLFVASASRSDPCSGRIFVELQNGTWRVIDSEKEFDALLSSLDSRGIRESHLRLMLKKIEMSFKDTVRKSLQSSNCSPGMGSPSSLVCGPNSDLQDVFSLCQIEIGRNEREKLGALRRYQDLQMWVWKESLSPTASCAMKFGKKRSRQVLDACESCLDSYSFEDRHCLSCHRTFDGSDFAEHEAVCSKSDYVDARGSNTSLPLGIKLLKALLASIEAFVPAEALESFWTESHRKSWSRRLAALSSIEELLQMLTAFESAIKPDFLSPNYETTKELLGTRNEKSDLASVRVLPWIPRTMSAVALRLFELDASIVYVKQEKDVPCYGKLDTVVTKQHRGYSLVKNKQVELNENFKEGVAVNPRSKRRRSSTDYGRVSKKQRRRTPTHKQPSQTSNRKSPAVNNQRQGIVAASRREVNIQEPSRGPRTVRKRRPENVTERMPPPKGPSKSLDEEEESYEIRRMEVDESGDSSSSDGSSSEEESDDDAAAPVDESDDNAAPVDESNGWRENSVEASDAEQEDEEMAEEEDSGNEEMSDGSGEDDDKVARNDNVRDSDDSGEDDDKVERNGDARDSDDSGEDDDDKVVRNDNAGDSDDSGESEEYSSDE
ncbi:Homeobox-DDT domain protein RLT1 [Linum grandiflorum]